MKRLTLLLLALLPLLPSCETTVNPDGSKTTRVDIAGVTALTDSGVAIAGIVRPQK